MGATHILGISGSLRRGSHNLSLLRAAAASLPPGAKLEIYDRLRDLPPYDADLDVWPAPEPVARLRRAIAAADGVLIATPEFNGSLPGVLKNALDWASRPFPDNSLRGKPAAVVGASTGLFGAVWAQAETRKVLGIIGADVLDGELPVGQAQSAFGADGHLTDAELRTALGALGVVLATRAGAAPESGLLVAQRHSHAAANVWVGSPRPSVGCGCVRVRSAWLARSSDRSDSRARGDLPSLSAAAVLQQARPLHRRDGPCV